MWGSVLVSAIVPLTLKPIALVPLLIAQSPQLVSLPGLLALLIASLRLQKPRPGGVESLVVLTNIEMPDSYAPISQGRPRHNRHEETWRPRKQSYLFLFFLI